MGEVLLPTVLGSSGPIAGCSDVDQGSLARSHALDGVPYLLLEVSLANILMRHRWRVAQHHRRGL